MIKLQKTNIIKTETYKLDTEYYIDIITNNIHEEYESYIYNINYGIKQNIFEMKKSDISKEEFIKLIEGNILDDIYYYKDSVENRESKKYAKETKNNIN